MAFPISLSFNKFNGLSKIDVVVSSLDVGGLVKLSMIWHKLLKKCLLCLQSLLRCLHVILAFSLLRHLNCMVKINYWR